MNLKEMLAKAKARLVEVKAAVDAGDDAKLEELSDAVAEVERLQAALAEADKAAGILAKLVNTGEGDPDEPADADAAAKSARTVGAKMAEIVKEKGIKAGKTFTVSAKAAGDANATAAGYAPVTTEYIEEPVKGARRAMTVADLFTQEPTTKSAVTYFVEGAVEGSITTVGEGKAFPKLHFGDPTPQTDALKKIGCVYKDTDELLDDAPRLAASIDERADYLMDVIEEDQLVSGDGTGSNLTGLLNRSGIQTASATGMEAAIKAIKKAKVGIKKNTPGFRADGLLINDEDWNDLTDVQDANKQFLAGGPFYGAYGNGSVAEEPPLWGLRVVPTQAVPKGTMVVGAFRLGGSVIRKGGRVVDMTNSDADDFDNGLIAFRPSERLALAVRYPAAFVKLTVTGA